MTGYLATIAVLVVCAALSPATAAMPPFVDVTEEAGIDFVSTNGATGRHLFPEFIGQGVALFDYDNDGHTDVYFVNGAPLEPTDAPSTHNALFRNRGDATFGNVTKQAGVGDTGYGHGCAVGDVDNDGWLDLFVTNLGENVLYRNRGQGTFEEVTFEDVTSAAGVAAPGFNTSCAFADVDNDGDLDLYIARYAAYDVATDVSCAREGVSVYCGPEVYSGAPDVLFRNRGDGTFEEATEQSGLAGVPPSHGLGVVFGDVNGDGFVDLYVANDDDPNFLFLNNGDGTFSEDAYFAGVALGAMGRAEAGMGTVLGDMDNDADLDIIVTNFQNETNSVYRNDGNGFFTDVAASTGMAAASHVPLGWGVVFVDFDADGWRDLFVANGHVQDMIADFEENTTYAQRDLLLRNDGGVRFTDAGSSSGVPYQEYWPSRGAAAADLDNDGDLDLVVANQNGRPNVLMNQRRGHWVGVRTVGTASNRFGVGARVTVKGEKLTQIAYVGGGGSYLSHNDLRLFFGLGTSGPVADVEVRWPSGHVDRHTGLAPGAVWTLIEGEPVSSTAPLPIPCPRSRCR